MGNCNLKLNPFLLLIIFIQLLSFIYIIITDNLNGDYSAFSGVNTTVLILSFIYSIIPFIWLKIHLAKGKQPKLGSLANFKYFNTFVIVLLMIDIFLSIWFKVGRLSASEIYNVPIYVKPLVVLINRIDIYILSGFLLISNFASKKIKTVVIILLVIFSLSKASVFVFLFLFLIYIGSDTEKIRFRNILLITILTSLIIYVAPLLFIYRESLRHSDKFILLSSDTNISYLDLIFSKLLGRISNLSSIVYFQENINIIANTSNRVDSIGYVSEFFKPIWGSFFRSNSVGYTYYFTGIFDPDAVGLYGIMYGLPSVLTLSIIKGPHVFILNLFLIIISINFIIKSSRDLFGDKYKIYSFILLFGPIMSGVSAEFGMLLLNLIILRFFKSFLNLFKS